MLAFINSFFCGYAFFPKVKSKQYTQQCQGQASDEPNKYNRINVFFSLHGDEYPTEKKSQNKKYR